MEEGEVQEVSVKKIGVLFAAVFIGIISFVFGIFIGVALYFGISLVPVYPRFQTYYDLGKNVALLFPVISGAIGFFIGIVSVLMYNLFARILGGIKLYS